MKCLFSILLVILGLPSAVVASYDIQQSDNMFSMKINPSSNRELAQSLQEYFEILSPAEKAAIDKGIDGSFSDITAAIRNASDTQTLDVSSAKKSELEELQRVLREAEAFHAFSKNVDSEKFLTTLNKSRDGCLGKQDDEGLRNLYYALALMASNKKCRIKSIDMKSAGQLTRSITLGQPQKPADCPVYIHHGASGSIGMGEMDIIGTDGATNTIQWQANHRIAGSVMSIREWLMGSQQHVGFIQQLEAKNFCDDDILPVGTGGDNTGVETNN